MDQGNHDWLVLHKNASPMPGHHSQVYLFSSQYIDVNDLQNFVNVALATAAGGEGDIAHDKLSNLRTVGSGFGSLIYDLRSDTGFTELSDRCASLWTALSNNPDLPNMLVRCPKTVH